MRLTNEALASHRVMTSELKLTRDGQVLAAAKLMGLADSSACHGHALLIAHARGLGVRVAVGARDRAATEGDGDVVGDASGCIATATPRNSWPAAARASSTTVRWLGTMRRMRSRAAV